MDDSWECRVVVGMWETGIVLNMFDVQAILLSFHQIFRDINIARLDVVYQVGEELWLKDGMGPGYFRSTWMLIFAKSGLYCIYGRKYVSRKVPDERRVLHVIYIGV